MCAVVVSGFIYTTLGAGFLDLNRLDAEVHITYNTQNTRAYQLCTHHRDNTHETQDWYTHTHTHTHVLSLKKVSEKNLK